MCSMLNFPGSTATSGMTGSSAALASSPTGLLADTTMGNNRPCLFLLLSCCHHPGSWVDNQDMEAESLVAQPTRRADSASIPWARGDNDHSDDLGVSGNLEAVKLSCCPAWSGHRLKQTGVWGIELVAPHRSNAQCCLAALSKSNSLRPDGRHRSSSGPQS